MNRFDAFYRGDAPSFGTSATREIQEYVDANGHCGRALDLGAGDGRNSLYLARTGFDVTAVDMSRVGLKKLVNMARKSGIDDRIAAVAGDVRYMNYPTDAYHLVAAVTIFDHLPQNDIEPLFERITGSIKPGGVLFVKSHTVDDPGFRDGGQPASELSGMIRHYFDNGELHEIVDGALEILSYDERIEEDTSHGDPHHHGFAIMLARKRNGRS